jgi:hypothetical protein
MAETFNKRQKAKDRQERQRDKQQRRAELREQKANRPPRSKDEDPDIAGIVPGPQPSPFDDD